MKNRLPCRAIALLVLCLLCTACSSNARAGSIHLLKTEGAVAVTDHRGRMLDANDGLSLYSGCGMSTRPVSYAWLELDRDRLAKLDADSALDIQKEGRDLTLQLRSGGLFFYVQQPLAADETMQITAASMTVGIRGTCGWITADGAAQASVSLLEGTVEVTAAGSDMPVQVSAGETARLVRTADGGSEITVSAFSAAEVPDFVKAEIAADPLLAQAVLAASGPDMPAADDGTQDGPANGSMKDDKDDDIKDDTDDAEENVEEDDTEDDTEGSRPAAGSTADYSTYGGSYTCSENGITVQLQAGNGYALFAPRPGDPAHSDMYALTQADGALQLLEGDTGICLLTVTAQGSALAIQCTSPETEAGSYLAYLDGVYQPAGG